MVVTDMSCFLRARFELLCSSLFNKSIQPIRPLLEKAGLSTSDINKVRCEREALTAARAFIYSLLLNWCECEL